MLCERSFYDCLGRWLEARLEGGYGRVAVKPADPDEPETYEKVDGRHVLLETGMAVGEPRPDLGRAASNVLLRVRTQGRLGRLQFLPEDGRHRLALDEELPCAAVSKDHGWRTSKAGSRYFATTIFRAFCDEVSRGGAREKPEDPAELRKTLGLSPLAENERALLWRLRGLTLEDLVAKVSQALAPLPEGRAAKAKSDAAAFYERYKAYARERLAEVVYDVTRETVDRDREALVHNVESEGSARARARDQVLIVVGQIVFPKRDHPWTAGIAALYVDSTNPNTVRSWLHRSCGVIAGILGLGAAPIGGGSVALAKGSDDE